MHVHKKKNRIFKLRMLQIEQDKSVTITSTDEFINISNYKNRSYSRSIYSIEKSKANPRTGVIWYQGKLVAESTIWNFEDLKKYEPKPKNTIQIENPVTILADNGYFHFIAEELPRRLQVMEIYGNVPTIISSKSGKYVEDAAKLLPSDYYACEIPFAPRKLIFSEKINGGIVTANDIRLLKNFANSIFRLNKDPYRRIFIERNIRAGAASDNERGLKFQNEISKNLESKGFEIFRLEQLSLLDQIMLFSEAKIVAGFHGAGLVNQVWMKPNSKVIEYTFLRRTLHFSHFSKLCGHDYTEISLLSSEDKG